MVAAAFGARAFDFSAVCGTGQTLYYSINGTAVTLCCPGNQSSAWGNYPKPAGRMVIPDSVDYNGTRYAVTSIGEKAFMLCDELTDAVIPSTVTTIGRQAFHLCEGLTELTIPATVTAIGIQAFSNVMNVVYAGTATGSPWGALNANGYRAGDLYFADSTCTTVTGCYRQATAATIPNTVTAIGSEAFRYCRWLESVSIPATVTSIGDQAFYYCTGLRSLSIPASVTSIGSSAFYYCIGIGSTTIPSTVSAIGSNAFYMVRHIEYHGLATGAPWGAKNMNCFVDGDLIYADSTRTVVVSCMPAATNIAIPNTVHRIGNYAFFGHAWLTAATIPNSVDTIGQYAFANCTSLDTVSIGDSASVIGDYAFYGCRALQRVAIPYRAEMIGGHAFDNCSALATVDFNAANCTAMGNASNFAFGQGTGVRTLNIGSRVHVIPNYAFASCTHLEEVTIPDTVTRVGSYAFEYCRGLRSATIGNGVTAIGSHAFYECTQLDTVTIGSSVATIGDNAFTDCMMLSFVTIPSTVTTIQSLAFWNVMHIEYYGTATGAPWGAKSMNQFVDGDLVFADSTRTTVTGCRRTATRVTVPATVTAIGYQAFYYCQLLEHIDMPATVASVGGGAFEECRSLDTAYIPANADTIASSTFSNCQSLAWAAIPATVRYIGYNAFGNCQRLTELELPDSLGSIGSSAFAGCTGLASITSRAATAPQLGSGAFRDVESSIPVYIPCGSLPSYSTAWSTFGNMIEGAGVLTVRSADPAMGRAEATGFDCADSTATVEATANSGYMFVLWSDFSSENPHSIAAAPGTVYTAYFVQLPAPDTVTLHDTTTVDRWVHDTVVATLHDTVVVAHTDTLYLTDTTPYYALRVLSAEAELGMAAGNGHFPEGCAVEIAALPAEGCRFERWSDGETENPRTVVVTEDMELTAHFAQLGVSEAVVPGISVGVQGRWIEVRGAEGLTVRIMDSLGRTLSTMEHAEAVARFRVPAAGAYMVQAGAYPAQKVVAR